jgi:hypothetical protein
MESPAERSQASVGDILARIEGAPRQRIDHEWRAAETFVEYRINTDEDRRAVESAARAIYDALGGARSVPPAPTAPPQLP